jgi:hypothetical protein
VKVDPKLGGQWKEKEKVLGLVANGRRRRRCLAWWPMEGKGEGSFLPLPLFPQATYLNLHFLSFTLRFYFTLVLGHYLRPPFVFLGL